MSLKNSVNEGSTKMSLGHVGESLHVAFLQYARTPPVGLSPRFWLNSQSHYDLRTLERARHAPEDCPLSGPVCAVPFRVGPRIAQESAH